MRNSLTTAAFCALLLFPNGQRATASSDAKPESVEVLLQNSTGEGVRLAIPKAYLKEHEGETGPRRSVRLDIRYPEIAPYYLYQSKTDLQKLLDAMRDKQAEVQDESHWMGYIHVRPGRAGHIEEIISAEVLPNTQYEDEAEPEFIHYRKLYGTSSREFLIPDTPSSQAIWFKCYPRDPARPRDQCEANTELGDRMYLQYTIPRSHLSRWRQVDEEVKAVIRSIVVDCFESPKLEFGSRPLSTHACPFI
jgi:hypothetical protein